jgi:hypothetical protein
MLIFIKVKYMFNLIEWEIRQVKIVTLYNMQGRKSVLAISYKHLGMEVRHENTW